MMLTDVERKVLRILFNRYRYAETIIVWDELERYSQREPLQLMEALGGLKDKRYIEWEPKMKRVKVLHIEERFR